MVRKRHHVVALIVILMTILAACTDAATHRQDAGAPVGDAAAGAALFARPLLSGDGAPGCATCHSLDAATQLVGPSLAGVATRAATTESAEQYLHTAIVAPDASVTADYTPGTMYQQYAETLNAQQIADLVAFLLTLE